MPELSKIDSSFLDHLSVGRLDLAAADLKKGANVNVIIPNTTPPETLLYFVASNYPEDKNTINFLIEHKANINFATKNGESVLDGVRARKFQIQHTIGNCWNSEKAAEQEAKDKKTIEALDAVDALLVKAGAKTGKELGVAKEPKTVTFGNCWGKELSPEEQKAQDEKIKESLKQYEENKDKPIDRSDKEGNPNQHLQKQGVDSLQRR